MSIKNKDMTAENIDNTMQDRRATRFWSNMATKVLSGIRMHRLTGQFEKGQSKANPEDPNIWSNVTEHCLVQVARSEILGKLIELPPDLIADMRMGAMLHDFDKKQQIASTRQANQVGTSPLTAVRSEENIAEELLETAGFSIRVRRLASASGGDAPVLIESQGILDKETLSNEDFGYLIVHYVDDCSIGTDWVSRSQEGRNIIDYRMLQNSAKPDYKIIAQEINNELSSHPVLGKMNIYDAAAFVSHQIEQRMAQRIKESTEEVIDPLEIPELIDQKIRDAIAAV